ncbi:hypothetical protein JTE90_018444 [Oedothorax gibbosus]|uniref:G-protein coupled receptors family 1 profile domain-containing protein n=1 Tax=Oedothorax gibbosus TaxID=931172 RepID=A0AAV6UZM0_9ARAC|nr:hypothetical protein JTE90_018444 [Oedothorax gibbosus]
MRDKLVAIFRVLRGPFVEDFYQCVTYGFYSALWQEQLYTSITLVLMFALPLVVIVATYTATFLTISDSGRKKLFSERTTRTPIDDTRYKILHKAKMKSLTITVVIVVAFVVCWTPYYVMMVIFMFLEPDEQLSQDLQSAIFFFGSSTALVNPLIYGAFHLRERPNSKKSRSKSTSFYYSSSMRLEPTVRKSDRTSRRSEHDLVHLQVHENGKHTLVVSKNSLLDFPKSGTSASSV